MGLCWWKSKTRMEEKDGEGEAGEAGGRWDRSWDPNGHQAGRRPKKPPKLRGPPHSQTQKLPLTVTDQSRTPEKNQTEVTGAQTHPRRRDA